MNLKAFISLFAIGYLSFGKIGAQETVIKTNLLYDVTANANIAVETRIAPLWTAELSGNLNLWKFSGGKQWRNYVLQPEIRRWFCRPFAGHFFGAHLLGGQYNIGHINMDFKMLGTDFGKLKNSRYQGWFVGAGIAYGYDWGLNRRWNMEAEIGFGWTYTRYDRFNCAGCGQKVESGKKHNYIGPTKAAVNLIYVF